MFSHSNHPDFPDLEGRRVTHFSEVLYYVVDGQSTDSIISWGQNGKSFVVWNLDKFCTDVLPKFNLRAHNLPLFIRKLESLGFRKVEESEGWEYAHDDHFVRGKPELTHEIAKAYRAPLAPKSLADLEKWCKDTPLDPAFFLDRNDPVFLEKRKAVLKAMAEKKALGEKNALAENASKLTISS